MKFSLLKNSIIKFLYVFFIFSILYFFSFFWVEANETEIKIYTNADSIIEAKPGEIITVVFQVVNLTSDKKELIEEIIFPENWKLITNNFSFTLESKKKEIRVISFLIPSNTLVGNNTIAYKIKEAKDNLLISQEKLQIKVLPAYELSLVPLDSKPYIIAGEEYEVKFELLNKSNVQVKVKIEVNNNTGFPFDYREEEILLEPDEAKEIKISIKTDKEIKKAIDSVTVATATILKDTNLAEKTTLSTSLSKTIIISRINELNDKYRYILSHLKLVAGNRTNYQFEFSGEGEIDEEGNKEIEFLLREPNIFKGNVLSGNGNYFLGYKDTRYEINIGDQVFDSYSLDNYRVYGRGLEGIIKKDDWSVGGFTAMTFMDVWESGFFLNWDSDRDNNEFQINYLNFVDNDAKNKIEGHNFSIYSNTEIIENNYLKLEYGMGKVNGEYSEALKGRIDGNFEKIDYHLDFSHVEPYFSPGQSGTLDSLYADILFSLNKKLTLRGSYHENSNKESDLEFENDHVWEQYKGISFYYSSDDDNIICSYGNRIKREIGSDNGDESDTDIFRIHYQKRFEKINYYSSYEWNKDKNILQDSIEYKHLINLGATYNPEPNKRYNFNYSFGSNPDDNIDFSHNFNFNTLLKNDYISLNWASLQRTSKEFSNELGVSFQHEFKRGDCIELKGEYSFLKGSFDEGVASVFFEYEIPINIPIGLNKNIGTLKGRIYNVDDRDLSGIKNVVINLNQFTAVTDEEGNFAFYGVKAGKYFLDVDYQTLKLDKIPEIILPFEFVLHEKEEKIINIGLTSKASLEGEIIQYNISDDLLYENGDYIVQENGKIISLILILKNESEIRRCFINVDGLFSFKDLRPGEWFVQIENEKDFLNHYVFEYPRKIDLNPGENKKIEIKIFPKKQIIKMINASPLPLEVSDK